MKNTILSTLAMINMALVTKSVFSIRNQEPAPYLSGSSYRIDAFDMSQILHARKNNQRGKSQKRHGKKG